MLKEWVSPFSAPQLSSSCAFGKSLEYLLNSTINGRLVGAARRRLEEVRHHPSSAMMPHGERCPYRLALASPRLS